MKRLSPIYITLCLVLAFFCQYQTVFAEASHADRQDVAQIARQHHQEKTEEDKLHGQNLSDNNAAAVLSEGQSAQRVCNARPQRILPVYASKHNRCNGRLSLSHFKTNLISPYGLRRVTLSAPFQAAVSCLYCVYALRHILR